jgi:hypothetical protein
MADADIVLNVRTEGSDEAAAALRAVTGSFSGLTDEQKKLAAAFGMSENAMEAQVVAERMARSGHDSWISAGRERSEKAG